MRRFALLSKHLLTSQKQNDKWLRTPTMRSLTSSTEPEVVVKEGPHFAEVMLNRPTKFNALNLNMVRTLLPYYSKWLSENSPIMCVLMYGAGGKAFCAGGDVAAIRSQLLNGGSLPQDFFYEEYQLNYRIAKAYDRKKLIQVSIWDGVTMGGGVGLSLHGKIRVATEKTLFAMPECGIGLFPDVGGTYALSRLKCSKAIGLYIALTGVRLGPADCLYAGLATHYIPSSKVEEFKMKLRSADGYKGDMAEIVSFLNEGAHPARSDSHLAQHADSIEECFSGISVEDIIERLKIHKRNESWAEQTLKTLSKLSPTSMKVSFEAIKLNSHQDVSIADALRLEYRISQRCMRPQPLSDFSEGIRAVLVEKDNNPKWQPLNLKDVKLRDVEQFFAPLDENHPRGDLILDDH